jgi:hypothetical protein
MNLGSRPFVPLVSHKQATGLTPAELTTLRELLAREQTASNAQSRAAIAVATAQQDRAEFIQELRRKYHLKGVDEIFPDDGRIVRKSALGTSGLPS